jgi:hypothetical protein
MPARKIVLHFAMAFVYASWVGSMLGQVGASVPVLRTIDPNLADTRYLLQNALANTATWIAAGVIAWGPLRRGERWAFWAVAVPIVAIKLPIALLNPPQVLSIPPAVGLAMDWFPLIGLAMVALSLFGPPRTRGRIERQETMER